MRTTRPSQEISRGSLFLSIEQISLAVFGVVYVMLLLRLLGPEQYGVFVVALAVTGLFGIATGNLEAFLERFTAEYRAREDWSSLRCSLLSVTIVKVALAALLWVVIAFTAGKIAAFYRMDVLKAILPVLGALVVTEAAVVSTRAFLYGLKKFGTIAALSAGTSVVKVGIVLYLLIVGASLKQLVDALAMRLLSGDFQEGDKVTACMSNDGRIDFKKFSA